MSELVSENCISCGIEFGMPAVFRGTRMQTHEVYYCPNGHGQRFRAPSVDPRDAELTALKAKLTVVEENLASMTSKAEALESEGASLRLELEIWRPGSAEMRMSSPLKGGGSPASAAVSSGVSLRKN